MILDLAARSGGSLDEDSWRLVLLGTVLYCLPNLNKITECERSLTESKERYSLVGAAIFIVSLN